MRTSIFRFPLASLALLALTAIVVVAPHTDAMAQAKQAPPKQQAAPPPPPALKQIALTDKQIDSLIVAQTEMDAITDKMPAGTADKPDAKLQAQFDSIVKKNGFASFEECGDVYDNVGLVISGIDPKTKAFTQPPEMLKKQIAEVTADTTIPAKDKKSILDEMKAAQATIAPVQFPANVTLVTKFYDKLAPLFADEE